MNFTSEQRVFIVETLQGRKLTEKVSVSFVVNIVTRQFPQSCVYPTEILGFRTLSSVRIFPK
jgi:hypothetical protein